MQVCVPHMSEIRSLTKDTMIKEIILLNTVRTIRPYICKNLVNDIWMKVTEWCIPNTPTFTIFWSLIVWMEDRWLWLACCRKVRWFFLMDISDSTTVFIRTWRLSMIVQANINVVLKRTDVDSDWRFNNLCRSHRQSQSELYHVNGWY